MSYYKRDTFSIKSNKILANLLAEELLLSEKVESFRQILASVPYYDAI
jgi:Ca2+-binding EF-hand superfamily protein